MADGNKKWTDDDLAQLISMALENSNKTLVEGMGANMLEAIREMKKLPPHEQEALDKKNELDRQRRIQRLRESIEHVRSTEMRQFYCSHTKVAEGAMAGGHAFRAQVNSDNCFRPMCIRCQKLFPKIKCTDEQLKSGIGLQNVKTLTAEVIAQWHIKNFPECPECASGSCAVKDLRQWRQGHLDPKPEVLENGKIRAEEAVGVA